MTSVVELDFALLADFATVEHGKLTVVGGCYTHALPGHPLGQPGNHTTYLAGRIRTDSTSPVTLGVRLTAPGPAYQIETFTTFTPPEATYDGAHRSIVFAARLDIPLIANGLYEVQLTLDAHLARRLAFTVGTPPVAGLENH